LFFSRKATFFSIAEICRSFPFNSELALPGSVLVSYNLHHRLEPVFQASKMLLVRDSLGALTGEENDYLHFFFTSFSCCWLFCGKGDAGAG
jgi:hypothetical protein